MAKRGRGNVFAPDETKLTDVIARYGGGLVTQEEGAAELGVCGSVFRRLLRARQIEKPKRQSVTRPSSLQPRTLEILDRLRNGEAAAQIARECNLTRQRVSQIKKGAGK